MALLIPVSPQDHRQGPDTAPLSLVLYGDYECPGCAYVYGALRSLQRQWETEAQLVFRHMPLSALHQSAEAAALAAEAASAQGRFWAMHEALFRYQNILGEYLLAPLAADLGLDVARFRRDLGAAATISRVRRDFLGAVRSGADRAPCLFINGEPFRGVLRRDRIAQALQQRLEPLALAG